MTDETYNPMEALRKNLLEREPIKGTELGIQVMVSPTENISLADMEIAKKFKKAMMEQLGNRSKTYTIGRATRLDPRLEDANSGWGNMSGEHCTIKLTEGNYSVTDTSSSNGTYLCNKKREQYNRVYGRKEISTEDFPLIVGIPIKDRNTQNEAFLYVKLSHEKITPKDCDNSLEAANRHQQRCEDEVLMDNEIKLYGNYDGVSASRGGSLKNGHNASSQTSGIIRKTFHEAIRAKAINTIKNAKEVMANAYRAANESIAMLAEQNPGLATTATTVFMHEGHYIIGHSGDSRALLIRDGKLTQLTQDHDSIFSIGQKYRWSREQTIGMQTALTNCKSESDFEKVVKQQQKLGIKSQLSQYNLKALRQGRTRNRMTMNTLFNAINGDLSLTPEITVEKAKKGDILLVCSDGLTGLMSNLTYDQISQIVKQNENTSAGILSDKLVEAAKAIANEGSERSKDDDISVVVIKN